MADLRVGLMQLGFAVGGAAVFLVAALILRRGLHLALEPSLAWTRPTFERIDRFLALNAARWVGLDEVSRLRRWGRLIGVLLGAAVAGALTPPVVAAPVLVLGLVAIVAVFRRWAWDEEDRAAGLGPEHKRAPGVEDFNNELMLALAAVFMLGGLLIWRLTGLHLFVERPGAGLMDGVLYVASEALEALPIFGNVEVLGYDNPSRVQAVLPTGGWVAFGLRMALDLMVIGGLLKALEIAGRVARGQDLRREEEAILQGEPARVRQAVERLGRLALGGDMNAADCLMALATDSEGRGHPVRARLQAAHMLLSVADRHPQMASSILRDLLGGFMGQMEIPGLEESGLKPALNLMLFELSQRLSERSHGDASISYLQTAIGSLGQAMAGSGLTPFPDAFLTDDPPPFTTPQHATLLVRYGRMLLTLGEVAHGDSARTYLENGVRLVSVGLERLSETEQGGDWASAQETKGQLLTRLAAHQSPEEAGIMLTDALDAFRAAEGALEGEGNAWARLLVQFSRGVTLHALGLRMKDEARRQRLGEAAAAFEHMAEVVEAEEEASDPPILARCLLNLGNVSLDLADAAETHDDATAWLDGAIDAYLRASKFLEGRDLPAEHIEANQGLANAIRRREQGDGGHNEWLDLAAAARRVVLDWVDERQDPLEWAVAAIDASEGDLWIAGDGVSSSMAETALERLRRARALLHRHFRHDLDERCAELEEKALALIRQYAEAERRSDESAED